MRIEKYLLAFFCTVVLASCGTTKVATDTSELLRSEKEMFASIISKSPEYKTFSAKANVTLGLGSGNVSSKATIKIIRDEVVQISLQPMLGIEMFRLQLTKDSLYIVDKMGKRYIAEPVAQLGNAIPALASVKTFQALLMNRLFAPERAVLNAEDYDLFLYKKEGVRETIQLKNSGIDDLTILFDTDNRMIKKTSLLLTNESGGAQWNYDAFKESNGALFPMQHEMHLKYNNKTVRLAITYVSTDWNSSLNTNFPIPQFYNRITMSDLLKMLMK